MASPIFRLLTTILKQAFTENTTVPLNSNLSVTREKSNISLHVSTKTREQLAFSCE